MRQDGDHPLPALGRLDLDGSQVDSQQFEELLSAAGTAEPGRAVDLYDRALSLWRGTAYGEFGEEWWVLTEANRLNDMRVVALEERAEALLDVIYKQQQEESRPDLPEPEMARIMQSDGTMKLEPRYGSAKTVDPSSDNTRTPRTGFRKRNAP